MIESTERPGLSWWALTRGKLAACWWRLLAVQVLFAAGGLAELGPRAAFNAAGLQWTGQIWGLVITGFVTAWSWSAMLRILDGGHGIPAALRPDPRRIGRLGVWLVLLNINGLLGLLAFVNSGAYLAIALSPAMPAVQLFALYASFAAALLPMAILLEGQGLRRAWRLSHGGRRTALPVLAVVVLGALVTSGVQQLQATTLGVYPPPPQFLPVQAATLVIGVLKATLTPVLLYAAYRLSPLGPVRAEPDRNQGAGASAEAPGPAPAGRREG